MIVISERCVVRAAIGIIANRKFNTLVALLKQCEPHFHLIYIYMYTNDKIIANFVSK